MKTPKQIAIWHGLDNHPDLEDCIKAMEEYAQQETAELRSRIKNIIYKDSYEANEKFWDEIISKL